MFLLAALVALHLPAVSPTAPNRQPQMAAAGGTGARWLGEGIWLARSLDSGRNFSAPPKLPNSNAARAASWPARRHQRNAIVVSAIVSSRRPDGWRSPMADAWTAPRRLTTRRGSAKACTPRSAMPRASPPPGSTTAAARALWPEYQRRGAHLVAQCPFIRIARGAICQCCVPPRPPWGTRVHRDVAQRVGGSRDFYTLRPRDGRPAGAAVKQGRAPETGRLPDGWRRNRRTRRQIEAPGAAV